MNRFLPLFLITLLASLAACSDDTAPVEAVDAGQDRGSSNRNDRDTGTTTPDTGTTTPDTGTTTPDTGTPDVVSTPDETTTPDTGTPDVIDTPDETVEDVSTADITTDAGTVPTDTTLFPDLEIGVPDTGSDAGTDTVSTDAADAGDVAVAEGTCESPIILDDFPLGDEGGIWGGPSVWGDTATSIFAPSCGNDDNQGTTPEDVFMFTPPSAGLYFFAAGSHPEFEEVDPIISIWSDCGTTELACGDDVIPVLVTDSFLYLELGTDPVYIGVEPYSALDEENTGVYYIVAGEATAGEQGATCDVATRDGTDSTGILFPNDASMACDWDAGFACFDGEGDDGADTDSCSDVAAAPVIDTITSTLVTGHVTVEDDEHCGNQFDPGTTADYATFTIAGTADSGIIAVGFAHEGLEDHGGLYGLDGDEDAGDLTEGAYEVSITLCLDPSEGVAETAALLGGPATLRIVDRLALDDGWHPDLFFMGFEDDEGDLNVVPLGLVSEAEEHTVVSE